MFFHLFHQCPTTAIKLLHQDACHRESALQKRENERQRGRGSRKEAQVVEERTMATRNHFAHVGFRPTTQSAQELVGDSVYVLFLTQQPLAMLTAVGVYAVQLAVLVVFGKVDWMANITRVPICIEAMGEAPVCNEPPGLTPGYLFLMVLILLFHTGEKCSRACN